MGMRSELVMQYVMQIEKCEMLGRGRDLNAKALGSSDETEAGLVNVKRVLLLVCMVEKRGQHNLSIFIIYFFSHST